MPAIASDNARIHQALESARRRGMKVWLLVVCTQYEASAFQFEPYVAGEIATISEIALEPMAILGNTNLARSTPRCPTSPWSPTICCATPA